MLRVRRAHTTEQHAVLRQTLPGPAVPPAEVERSVDGFLRYAHALNLDISNQWIAENGSHWLACCACIESPGRTATVLLSRALDEPARQDAGAILLDEVRRFARQRRLRLIQSWVEADDPAEPGRPPPARAERTVLAANGFERLALLQYRERRTRDSDHTHAGPRLPPTWSWTTYDEHHHGLFADTILDTYAGSRDCQRLNGLREIDDVIMGHKAAALHDPLLWFLLRSGDRTLGCILLGEIPTRKSLEVIYMGVRPDARRQGVGGLLIRRAMAAARENGLTTVTLAVDYENEPARRLYDHFALRVVQWREAWIHVVDGAPLS
jgi:GNAT superfamily N-acetyltransferase